MKKFSFSFGIVLGILGLAFVFVTNSKKEDSSSKAVLSSTSEDGTSTPIETYCTGIRGNGELAPAPSPYIC